MLEHLLEVVPQAELKSDAVTLHGFNEVAQQMRIIGVP